MRIGKSKSFKGFTGSSMRISQSGSALEKTLYSSFKNKGVIEKISVTG